MAEINDARTFRTWRKIAIVITVACFAFLSTFGASIISPGRQQIEEDFGLSRTASVLPFSLFNLGLAWGSIVASPISEEHGRRTVYVAAEPLLLIFVMASGFAPNYGSLLVFRLLGGICGSPALSLASATIADLFAPGRARGIAIFCYFSMPFLGAVVGPFIGFFVVDKKPWQWTQWVYLFIASPIVLLGLALMKETKSSVLAKRASSASEDSSIDDVKPGPLKGRALAAASTFKTYIRSTLLRPLKMLFTEPIVGSVCLYAGFNFGLIYSLIIVFPLIFHRTYNFDLPDRGLSFLGLIAGCIVGPAFLIADNEVVQRRKARADQEKGPEARPSPEIRLHGAMVGGVALPIGLFWFAWTAQPGISYLSPIFASVLITCGALLVYVSMSAYVVDVYGPRYGASANAASSISRYTMAAAIPLFILQMYSGLGTGWATSLLGFCALVLMPVPFCFFRWGPALRKRCKFPTESVIS